MLSAHGGLDREQMRQVFVNIGRPVSRRHTVLTDLMGAVRLVGHRTLMLLILLGLVIVLALSPAAWGAEGLTETVQKGQGGVGKAADTPLRDRANFFPPRALAPVYNFLQNFPEPRAQSAAPAPAPEPRSATRPLILDRPTKLAGLLALICLLILWIHLRSTRMVPESSRSPRSGRSR